MTKDEERARRVHVLLYSTDDRADLCERIVSLEDLASDLLDRLRTASAVTEMGWTDAGLENRARDLGFGVTHDA